jgi:ERCC4-type nuclease
MRGQWYCLSLRAYNIQQEFRIFNRLIIRKLGLIASAFPQVSILWSSSPKSTTAIFKAIKEKMEEPNAEVATKIGKFIGENDDDNSINPLEILSRLLGANSAILLHSIKTKYRNLIDLASESKTQLCKNLGEDDGSSVYGLLHNKIPIPTDISLVD